MILFKRFILAVLLLVANFLYSQELVDVDPYSGSAIINIPITSISSGSIEQQISISYVGNGIKADAPSGSLGTGWSLNAGGLILRTVKGLPDDYESTGTGSEIKKGWLVDGTHITVGNFAPTADADLSTSEDEAGDYDYLKQFGGFSANDPILDTEPDIFQISAPGLSGSFVFNHEGQIEFLNHSNLTVTYFYDANERLGGFTVTNDAGFTYRFGKPLQESLVAEEEEGTPYEERLESNTISPPFFARDYYMFREVVYYNNSWHLLNITNTEGDRINFEYIPHKPIPVVQDTVVTLGSYAASNETYDVYLYDPATDQYSKKIQYFLKHSFFPPMELAAIRTSTREIEFLKNEIMLEYGYFDLRRSLLNWINVYDLTGDDKVLLRRFVLDYGLVKKSSSFESTNHPYYTHIFLKGLKESKVVEDLIPYTFDYYGVDLENEKSLLADRSTKYKDIYGFIASNVENSGMPPAVYVYPDLLPADQYRYDPIPGYEGQYYELEGRTYKTDITKLTIGSLKSVTRPGGAKATVRYEPNDYYDPISGTNIYGGGIRVRQLEITDGTGYTNRIVKQYKYETASGRSSGIKSYMPKYDFQLNHYYNPADSSVTYYEDLLSLSEEEQFKRLNIRTTRDLNQDGGVYVAYERIQVIQEGKGRTEFHFDIPRRYNTQNLEGGWEPTTMRMAREWRETADSVRGHLIADLRNAYVYPFAPNPRYDKQGILIRQVMYDEQDNKVRSVEHEYGQVGNNDKVSALNLDRYLCNIDQYTAFEGQGNWYTAIAPYFIYAQYPISTANKLVRKGTIEKNYLPSDSTRFVASSYESIYNDDDSKYLRQTVSSGADGVKYITRYSYGNDFSISGTWSELDSMSRALLKFKLMSMESIPVEVLSLKVDGLDTLVMGAKLNIYTYNADYNQINILRKYALNKSKLLTAFSPAHLETINNQLTFIFDTDYQLVEHYTDFDNHGRVGSVIGYDGNASSQLYDRFGRSRATFSGVKTSQFIFADFEHNDNTSPDFNDDYLVDGYISGNAYNLTTGPEMSAAFSKKENRYIFSGRTKLAGDSGNFDLVISDGQSTHTIPVLLSGSEWTFFQQEIDLSTYNQNELGITIRGNNVYVDDIAIYPYSASYQQNYYGYGGHLIATANMDNHHTYFEYDFFDRMTIVRDNDKNIVKRTTFTQPGYNSQSWNPQITYRRSYNVNENVKFASSLSHLDNLATFKWKIKKYSHYGNSLQAAMDDADFSQSQTLAVGTYDHVFTEPGEYIIKLQATLAGVSKTDIKKIEIRGVYPPMTVEYEANQTLFDVCIPSQQLQVSVAVGGGSGDYSYDWYYKNKNTVNANEIKMNISTATFSITQGLYSRIYYCKITDNVTGNTLTEEINNTDIVDGIRISVFASNPSCESEIPSEQ